MKSLAYTDAEIKKRNKPSKPFTVGDASKYPWGLSLTLDEASIKKLGLKKLPSVGKRMTITCEVEVKGVRQNETQDGDDRSLELQVCAMEMEDDGFTGYTGDDDFAESVAKATKRDLGRG
jgi:hypothetical protein